MLKTNMKWLLAAMKYTLLQFYRYSVLLDSLCFGVKDVGGPAVHETWVSCEPQHHHEDEEGQDVHLSITHGSQSQMLFPDHLVCQLLPL